MDPTYTLQQFVSDSLFVTLTALLVILLVAVQQFIRR